MISRQRRFIRSGCHARLGRAGRIGGYGRWVGCGAIIRLIAPEHLYERAGVVGEAANPAIGLEPVEVFGQLASRSTDRAGNPAHRHVEQRADRVSTKLAADQLDRRHFAAVGCDRRSRRLVVYFALHRELLSVVAARARLARFALAAAIPSAARVAAQRCV
jgi:hypothetical protein